MLSHVIPQCLVTDRITIKLQLTGKSRLIFKLNLSLPFKNSAPIKCLCQRHLLAQVTYHVVSLLVLHSSLLCVKMEQKFQFRVLYNTRSLCSCLMVSKQRHVTGVKKREKIQKAKSRLELFLQLIG